MRTADLLGFSTVMAAAVYLATIIGNIRPAFLDTAKSGGVDFPPPSDLVYALTIGTFVVVVVRETAEPLLAKLAKKVLSAKKLAVQDRVERFSACSFKFFAYLALSWYGYACLKDEDWFPKAMGGTAQDASTTLIGWPLHQTTVKMRCYYGAALSYHGHSIFFLLRQWYQGARRNDFYEMSVHHLVTITLITGSHMLNFTRIGSLVLFIHDVSDIFTYQIKAFVDMDILLLTAWGFLSCVCGWFYFRLWLLPNLLIRDILNNPVEEIGWGNQGFTLLLSALVCLHAYWMSLVLEMGRNAIMGTKGGVHQQDHYQLSMEEKNKSK